MGLGNTLASMVTTAVPIATAFILHVSPCASTIACVYSTSSASLVLSQFRGYLPRRCDSPQMGNPDWVLSNSTFLPPRLLWCHRI